MILLDTDHLSVFTDERNPRHWAPEYADGSGRRAGCLHHSERGRSASRVVGHHPSAARRASAASSLSPPSGERSAWWLWKKLSTRSKGMLSIHSADAAPCFHHCTVSWKHAKTTGVPKGRHASTASRGSPFTASTATHADLESIGIWANPTSGTEALSP
jgi:hypothetical protein